MADDLSPISSIPNLGAAAEEGFARAGITSAEALRALGPDEAYLAYLGAGHRPHFIFFYAMIMGLQGRMWNDCKGAEKAALRLRFDAIKARAQAAQFSAQVEQDLNALRLAVGTDLPAGTLGAARLDPTPLAEEIPIGQSSLVLLSRPDVQSAERQLMAANADIGAARAAMFPRISLTSAIGVASSALSSLFTGDAFAWSAAPSASLPIFGGPVRGNIDFSKAQRDMMLAQYEGAIQTAFREVADALARDGTIDAQQAAQRRLVIASQRAYALSEDRYRAGIDTFLTTLTSQRTLYAARQSAIATDLALLTNRILLYRVIGADQ